MTLHQHRGIQRAPGSRKLYASLSLAAILALGMHSQAVSSDTTTANDGFGSQVYLSDLLPANGGNGSAGFVLRGFGDGARLGEVSGIGDINGDAINDIAVAGVYWVNPDEVYIIFGRSDGFPAELFLADLAGGDGSVGFVVSGAWRPANGVGDLNGDGIQDLVIGDYRADPDGRVDAGRVFVVFGRETFPAVFNASTLLPANGGDGSQGFVLNGEDDSQAGWSMALGTDVNGDGRDDLLIGAPFFEPDVDNDTAKGRVYALFGRDGGFAAESELGSLSQTGGGDGSAGFVISVNDTTNGHKLGKVALPTGDIDGDNIGDILVGGWANPFGGSSVANRRTYVVFGRSGGFPAEVPVESLDGATGFEIIPEFGEEFSNGGRTADAADINGDGVNDLMFTTALNGGRVYVLFGRAEGGFPAELRLLSLRPSADGDGSTGFVLLADEDIDSLRVTSAGDIDGDGVDDVLIGSENLGATGKSFVYFGKITAFDPEFSLTSLQWGGGSEGFVLNGIDSGDNAGRSVSGLGDVNGDGVDDIVVGAPFADPFGHLDAGESYVVFGLGTLVDTDGDLVGDDFDNCMFVPNTDQQDIDNDNYGNMCDADFNQDCLVNFADLLIMKAFFFVPTNLVDLTGDNFVNFDDLNVMKLDFFQPPGPSGTTNVCD